MARVLSTAFCVALLAATAAAFAVTEGAKTEISPIYHTEFPIRVFSPTCNPRKIGCRQVADISFSLRKKEHIQLWIEQQGNGRRVETIVSGRTFPKGPVDLEFDGVAANGATLPDGVYQPVIRLEHHTIRFPNLIRIDTKPPRVVRFPHRVYTHISPDGDGRDDVFRIHYTLDGPAHGVLLVDNRQVVLTRSSAVHGTLSWGGKVDGKLASPGNHVLEIAAQDAAGNRSKPFPFAVVTIRYVRLGRTRILVRPGGRFAVGVITDAKTVTWLFARGRGTSNSHTLKLRAPAKSGVYHLFVSAASHTAAATVVVG